MKDEVLKNGYAGKLAGYKIHGKSYDTEGNEVAEVHEEDCFCCCKNLLKPSDKSHSSQP